MPDRRWVRVVGDGLVYSGPCLVYLITLDPGAGGDSAVIYDGRDATSGKKFMTLTTSIVVTRDVSVSGGVPFDQGIYVDATDSDVETTIVFAPL